MKKILISMILYTVVAVLVMPAAITILYGNQGQASPEKTQTMAEKTIDYGDGVQIKVLNPQTQEVVETGFEEYIKGVVGAEMPALFEEEALKAQAVAARTYAVREMKGKEDSLDPSKDPYEIGQAFMTQDELKEKWGSHFNEYYKKVSNAVDDTKDLIMVYEDEPILAVFHSTSSGKTETAANVWGQDVPYLVSVDSVLDEQAPDFLTETSMLQGQAIGKLQAKYSDLILTEGSLYEQMQIISRTPAGYISTLQIGNKVLSGREVREALGLKSTDFTIKQNGDSITFITKGYGHGAGMSQYGANFMAKQGSTYEEILKHYYQGIELVKK